MGQANYCAAKAGLIGLTKATARELAIARDHRQRRRARVRPDRADPGPARGAEAEITTRTPLGRFGTTEEIANAVAFLACDEAALHHRPGPRRRRRPGDDVARARSLAATFGATLAGMRIRPFSISGLGHLSSLIADEAAGVAAVDRPAPRRRHLPRRGARRRRAHHPRRRDASPQRLRVGWPRARRADRRDPRHRRRRRAPLRAPWPRRRRRALRCRGAAVRRRSTPPATRPSTSATPSPTRRAPTTRRSS